ncbi:hypothetical protein TVAG_388400 [Trichomonas vaginalis G3]|uniref:Right handed beta helix domain-containing protein n=1 Tax=Trichomonas vaginalis (strain ATCC PRA-98 / G3) TaxID=412133 RepID=A2DYH4_TRIV3|nr:pectin lyase-like family [Trichomonas vaginalis G3]EAY14509.1 hypothetical protein TVAG_388400 [Trichomonas vaginalis G3]KAI5529318.1 pectin lyase-like family [Trichomonas vaginalis G3]|eukprot:XP_001326732.1 hypothetical protein [Trichomonas vaginalis G3]
MFLFLYLVSSKIIQTSFESTEDFICEPLSPCSIETALSNVESNDTITISDNIIDDQSDYDKFYHILSEVIKRNLSISGSNTIINFKNILNPSKSIITLQNSRVTISNFIFSEISHYILINSFNSNITFENCIFKSCNTSLQIFESKKSNISFINCNILENIAYQRMFSIQDSSITMINVTFSRNCFRYVNCFSLDKSSIITNNLCIQNNSLPLYSFIYAISSKISHSSLKISNNVANPLFFCDHTSLIIEEGSVIKYNLGTIATMIESSFKSKDLVLKSNSADSDSLIYSQFSSFSLENCNIISNFHLLLKLNHTSAKIKNCTIISNIGSVLWRIYNSNADISGIYINETNQKLSFDRTNLSFTNSIISHIQNISLKRSRININQVYFGNTVVNLFKPKKKSLIQSSSFYETDLKIEGKIKLNSILFDQETSKKLETNVFKMCRDCEFDSQKKMTLLAPLSTFRRILQIIFVLFLLIVPIIWLKKKIKFILR